MSDPEPIFQERTSWTPSATDPRMTSEEPPPTSTTAMLPSTAWPSDLVAPRKARRPSSSSSSTTTSTPACLEILLATFSLFLASRIAAVATVLITSAPISWARRTCVSTTSVTSATFSSLSFPLPLARSLPIAV